MDRDIVIQGHSVRVELSWTKQEYDLNQARIGECLSSIDRICDEHFSLAMKLLKTVPVISQIAGMTIIAELS